MGVHTSTKIETPTIKPAPIDDDVHGRARDYGSRCRPLGGLRGRQERGRATTTGRAQPEHLHPALALWDYAERSAAWALDQTTGDPPAEHVHAALARSPNGLTRTWIRDLCHRHIPADRVEQALHALVAAGRAQQERTITRGRPAELWTAAAAPSA